VKRKVWQVKNVSELGEILAKINRGKQNFVSTSGRRV
jgi:hypothetical protein